jgi:hypothetical protein
MAFKPFRPAKVDESEARCQQRTFDRRPGERARLNEDVARVRGIVQIVSLVEMEEE